MQGWYIIAYGLGIYMLNLFIAFLTPKIDPALAEVQENGKGHGVTLPVCSVHLITTFSAQTYWSARRDGGGGGGVTFFGGSTPGGTEQRRVMLCCRHSHVQNSIFNVVLTDYCKTCI